MEGKLYESNGYFPQALINFLFGITLKIWSGKREKPYFDVIELKWRKWFF
jgi:hypothetical protein